jgi:hypothetical protein
MTVSIHDGSFCTSTARILLSLEIFGGQILRNLKNKNVMVDICINYYLQEFS